MENEINPLQHFIDSARRVFEPRMNYQVLPTPMLILEAAKEWTTALEIVVRMLDFPELEQELALRISRSITARAHEPKYLEVLYSRNRRLEPLRFLLFHLFAAEHILAELSRRLSAPLRVASVLAAVSAPDGRGRDYYDVFLKALNIDRLEDCGDREDPSDLRHDAIVGALEKARKVETRLRGRFPKPLAFVITPELADLPECRRWDWPEFYREEMARVWAALGVYFHEEIERLSAGAWQGYHDRVRKHEALKRGGPGRKPPGTDKAAEVKGESDGKQTRGERRRVIHQEFDDKEYISASAKPETAAHFREIARVARKHLGAKAQTYFEERAKGARQNESAKAAGVSDRMARKYQTRMRALLGIAKPSKKV
jgi:hypothetical protein